MTRQTFYRFLKRTQDPADWFLNNLGAIRRTATGSKMCLVCPLGALPEATTPTPVDSCEVGGVMSQGDMRAIYLAADNDEGFNSQVRAALLRNLGLTEATT